MPKPEEKPGFLEKVGNGLEKTAKGTWDALVNNEKLHQGVEVGARAAWETSKTVGGETLRQADRMRREGSDFGEDPGLAQYAGVLLKRYKNPRAAYERIPEYREEIEDLARRIREQRDKVYGKN